MADLPKMWDKMSKALQKRWWAAHGGGKPFPAEEGGRSAAAAKRSPVKKGVATSELSRGEKTSSGKMSDVRRENMRRMKAAMERGTAGAPQKTTGAGGSGMYSPSSMKDIRAAIKSGAGVRTGLAGHSDYDKVMPEKEKKKMREEVEEMYETSMIGGKKLDPKSLVWKQTGMNYSAAVSRHGKENVKIAGKNHFGEPIVHVKVPLGEEIEQVDEAKVDNKHPIVKEYESMKKMNIKDIRNLLKQQQRIIDTSEYKNKNHAISDYLRNKHGNKRVAAAFGLEEEVEQVDEGRETTHEDPLVTVHRYEKGGRWALTGHMNLSTAQDIHSELSSITANHVHRAGVGNMVKNDKRTHAVALSKHHEKQVVKEEVETVNEAQPGPYNKPKIKEGITMDRINSILEAAKRKKGSPSSTEMLARQERVMRSLRSGRISPEQAAAIEGSKYRKEELKREFDPRDEYPRDQNHPDSYKLKAPKELVKNPKFALSKAFPGLGNAAEQGRKLGVRKEETEQVDEVAKWRTHSGAHEYDTDGSILPTTHGQIDKLKLRSDYLSTAKNYIAKNIKNPKKAKKQSQQYAKSGIKLYSITKEEAKQVDEEVEYIEEKLTAADPASTWISDFVKSDNPRFEGKSKEQRKQMALGAYYSAKRSKNEEVVQEKLDPVGGETADIDNDKDVDKTDRYLHARRQKIGAAIAKKKGM